MAGYSLLLIIATAHADPLTNLGDLTITEFQADTVTVAQYYGEWFEIYNNSGSTQDLLGLRFTHDDGLTVQELVLTSTYLLGAFDYVVLGVSSDLNSSSPLWNGNVPIDITYAFFNANDPSIGFNISLQQDWLQVYTPGGVLLDEVSWNPSWGAQADSAMQVGPNAFDVEWANDFPTNWCPSQIFIPVSGMHGSPGVENDYCGVSPGEDIDQDRFSKSQGDCRDDDPYVNPDAVDVGTGIYYNTDDDCDGVRDDGETDDDGDGFTEVGGDCDDSDGGRYPGAREGLDGEDDDCNGCIDDLDDDGDGFTECQEFIDADGDGLEDDPWYDCDDSNAAVNPEIAEIPYDGIDQDCNIYDLCDLDSDGYGFVESLNPGICESGADDLLDCDDVNPQIHPGIEEVPDDGLDNDCDGIIDVPDRDGDGYTADDGDCMDLAESDLEDVLDAAARLERSVAVHPGAEEICGDLVDNDCNGFADDRASCQNAARYGTIQGGGICGLVAPSEGGVAGLVLAMLGLGMRRRTGKRGGDV